MLRNSECKASRPLHHLSRRGFTGCAQDLIFSNVNRDTVEVLVPQRVRGEYAPSSCCGSLHDRCELELARQLARKTNFHHLDRSSSMPSSATLAAAPTSSITNCSWPATALPGPRRALDKRSNTSGSSDWHPPAAQPRPAASGDLPRVVPPGARPENRQAAPPPPGRIPNLKLVELPESSWCRGSAGDPQPHPAGNGRPTPGCKLNHAPAPRRGHRSPPPTPASTHRCPKQRGAPPRWSFIPSPSWPLTAAPGDENMRYCI